MDRVQIEEAARALGIATAALDQIVARAREHFGDGQVKPADLDTFLTALPVWTKLNMDQATFNSLPTDWRLTQARRFTPPVVHRRRPVMRALTPAELASLEAEHLPWAEHREKARAMQQTPAPGQP